MAVKQIIKLNAAKKSQVQATISFALLLVVQPRNFTIPGIETHQSLLRLETGAYCDPVWKRL